MADPLKTNIIPIKVFSQYAAGLFQQAHFFDDRNEYSFYYFLMKIRAVRSEDFETWLSLWEGYNSFYNRSISQDVTHKTWKRFLDAGEPVYALVAEVDGEIVGFTAYLFHRHTAMVSDVCYLQDLFTNEKFRGRGIGKSLIQAVSDRAKENGSIQVYWMTHESNETARVLYDKVAKHSGFIVYSKRA